MVNTAKVEPGRSAVIIGTGGVGLNAVQGAALAGAHPIIAVDIRDDKLAAARSFSATHAVNIDGMEAPEEAIRELTSGRGRLCVCDRWEHPGYNPGLRDAGQKGAGGVGGLARIWSYLLCAGLVFYQRMPDQRQLDGVDATQRRRAASGRSLPAPAPETR